MEGLSYAERLGRRLIQRSLPKKCGQASTLAIQREEDTN